jgi:ABC-type uncharacterized transport system permease subunit
MGLVDFAMKQLSDESFGLRYTGFQNEVASQLHQIMPYLAIILVVLIAIFIFWKARSKSCANQG